MVNVDGLLGRMRPSVSELVRYLYQACSKLDDAKLTSTYCRYRTYIPTIGYNTDLTNNNAIVLVLRQ